MFGKRCQICEVNIMLCQFSFRNYKSFKDETPTDEFENHTHFTLNSKGETAS